MGLFIFWGIRYYRQRQLLNQKKVETLKAEQENSRLKGLLEGQLLERNRISQEMHDDIGSGLTSILFLSRTLQGQETVLMRLRKTAEQLIQKMNEIIWIMNNEQDTLDSLVAYMRLHIAETLDDAGIEYEFSITDSLPVHTLNQEFRRNLYLGAKEAVHNIIKHAGATQVTIFISTTNHLELIIEDDGKGLNTGETSFGNGLRNMRRRMEQVGGTFIISGSPQGTRVVLSAPLPV
jgi:signal transduction histidine kinase